MKIIVYHTSYGCDTGCCGHTVKVTEGEDPDPRNHFEFDHPYHEDPLEFARDMVRDTYGEQHVADLDWDNCLISED